MKRFTLAVALALLAAAAPAFATLDDYGSSTISAGTPRWCKDINKGESTAAWTVSGTWTGVITFQAVTDKVPTFTSTWAMQLTTRTWSQTVSANGVYVMPLQGFNKVCANFGTPTSGSPALFVNISDATFTDLSWALSTNRINCRLTTAATTSTSLGGQCVAPGAGLSLYISDISVYGGVATGAAAAASVQSGTGGTCGVATNIIYDCQHGATAGCEHTYANALKLPANSELCLIDATVGTKFISVSGFIAP
jgi:hypothetical protein